MGASISMAIAQNSQSVTNNNSNVTVSVTVKWTNGSFNHVGCWLNVTIDGSDYGATVKINPSKTTSGSEIIFTKTLNIAHNTDGTKTLKCSAYLETGISSGTVETSASKTLTTIPRKSSLTVSNGTLGTKQTLTVTRKSSSFTHTITYKCGSASGTICTKSSSTSIVWTPPLSLAKQNTTGTSVSVTLTITTYNGSASVGSNTKTITCSIPSSVKPSCSLEVTDPTGYLDTYGNYIKGQSKFKVVVKATKSYDSEIASYSVTANGSKYTSSSFTTGALTSSGSLTVSATVTDKRGRSGSASVTLEVLDCIPPAITKLAVNRCDKDGTENGQGEYIKVTFSANVTNLDGQNTAAYVLKYKKSTESTYTEVSLGNLANVFSVTDATYIFPADTGSSYDIELDVTDNFTSAKRTTSASTAFTIMHWKADGTGMAVGKISELSDVFDIGLQTRFFGGILHPVLEPETDLNDVRTPNTYVGANVSNFNYANCPLTTGTFTLEVVGMGDAGQVKQRLTYCHKTAARAWERIFYTSEWGEWVCVSDFDGQLLWSGGYYMTDDHKCILSEPISKQRSGIVLVFSAYVDGAAQDYWFCNFFVPKYVVSAHPGKGHEFIMATNTFGSVTGKYLYISDDIIKGASSNNATGTAASGITYNNAAFVLRYVIGV